MESSISLGLLQELLATERCHSAAIPASTRFTSRLTQTLNQFRGDCRMKPLCYVATSPVHGTSLRALAVQWKAALRAESPETVSIDVGRTKNPPQTTQYGLSSGTMKGVLVVGVSYAQGKEERGTEQSWQLGEPRELRFCNIHRAFSHKKYTKESVGLRSLCSAQ